MERRLYKELGIEVVEIHIGEFYATRDGEPIATLLGSCVAACIFDPVHGVGGMNHFMLPGHCKVSPIYADAAGRYAMFAMERLVNEVLKLGGERSFLRAKVFGGASVLGSLASAAAVAEQNVLCALEYLRSEGIPLVSSDAGGTAGRRIIFFPATGRVLLRRLQAREKKLVTRAEERASRKIAKESSAGNCVEWFP